MPQHTLTERKGVVASVRSTKERRSSNKREEEGCDLCGRRRYYPFERFFVYMRITTVAPASLPGGCRKQRGYTKRLANSQHFLLHAHEIVFRPVSFAWRLPVSRTFSTQHSTHHSYDCCTAIEQQMVVVSRIDAAYLETTNYRLRTVQ